MAHYAFLDENNIVVQVIVGNDEGDADWEFLYSNAMGKPCKRTSYNTRRGIYYGNGFNNPATEDQTKAFRKNYAGVGFKYYADSNLFAAPQPYASWTLNTTSGGWDAPITEPTLTDAEKAAGKFYSWDESAYQADNSTGWVLITP